MGGFLFPVSAIILGWLPRSKGNSTIFMSLLFLFCFKLYLIFSFSEKTTKLRKPRSHSQRNDLQSWYSTHVCCVLKLRDCYISHTSIVLIVNWPCFWGNKHENLDFVLRISHLSSCLKIKPLYDFKVWNNKCFSSDSFTYILFTLRSRFRWRIINMWNIKLLVYFPEFILLTENLFLNHWHGSICYPYYY